MTNRALLSLLALALLGGCAGDASVARRLAPRAAETIDPRVPILSVETVGPISAGLAARLRRLEADAEAGTRAFNVAADAATSASTLAGPAQSESWIAAQQKLSIVIAARAPVTKALADIDAVGAEALARSGGLSVADRRAIAAAARAVGDIDRRQAAVVAAISERLRR